MKSGGVGGFLCDSEGGGIGRWNGKWEKMEKI